MTPFNKKLMAFVVVFIVLVQVKTVSFVWRDIGKSDFGALYAAGQAIVHRSDQLFRMSPQLSPEPKSGNSGPLQPADTLHPPFELLIFAPLAALPYRAAFIVWYVCNLLMLASVPVLLWSSIPRLHARFPFIAIPLGTCFPVVVTLVQGQDSLLLLLLFTACFLYLKQGREVHAGAALALGMFKFMLVLPMIVAFAVTRRWRILTSFAIGCVALLLVSFAMMGRTVAITYVTALYRYSHMAPERSGAQVSLMPNLRGLLDALTSSRSDNTAITVTVLIFSIAVLAVVIKRWAARQGDRAALDLSFSMLVTATAVISYHFFVHNATILLLPLLLGAQHLGDRELRTRTRVTFASAAACLYFAPYLMSLRVAMPMFFLASVGLLGSLYDACAQNGSRACDLDEIHADACAH